MKQSFVAVRAFIFASGFLWLWVWIAAAVRRYDQALPFFWLPAGSHDLGFVALAAGMALTLWCISVFIMRGQGTPAPFDSPRKLVAAGPYRFLRNPMYVGGGLVFLGCGLVAGSPSMVLFTPVWFFLFHLLVRVYEEPVLRERFGHDYDEYCRRTSRWIPRLGWRTVAGGTVLLLGAALLEAEDRPNFSGEWKLNVEASDFGVLPGPQTRVDQIRHDEPVLRLTSRQVRGHRESVAEWECRTNGTPCGVSVRGSDLRLATSARWDGGILVLHSHGEYSGGKVEISERWTLAVDRRTLTIARRMSNDAGETHQNLVLERQ